LADHPFNFNFIFLSDGLMAVAERAAYSQLYTTASRCYSAATDGRRAAKSALGVAWAFGRQTLPVEKYSEFKCGKYGGQSVKNQNSAMAANCFGW
jgi:hypothetical protein